MTGVRRAWVAAHNFAMLHFDLVDALGGSYEAAVLLDRIIYHGRDEGWVATRPDMQAACRLSEWKLDRAIKELREAGFITDERVSHMDSTRRWSVMYEVEETTPYGVQESALLEVQESWTTPSSKKGKKTTSSNPAGFDEWWTVYPKHVGKQAAIKAWVKATATTDSATILDGTRRLLPDLTEKKQRGFCPDPATWLNAGRWEDETTNHTPKGTDMADLRGYL